MGLSSIGKKTVVAVTGALLVGFLIAHMAGNLIIFEGRPAINAYAEKLQSLGPLLWLVRLSLLALFVLHVVFTIMLARENSAARPVGYVVRKPRQSTLASRTMLVSGLVVFGFLVYHVLHFTAFTIKPSYAGLEETTKSGDIRHDVFAMLVDAFSNPVVVVFYVAAQVLIFFHLSHGVKSFLHTLGLSNQRLWPLWKKVGPVVAGVITAGFIAVPVSVWLGVVKPTAPNVSQKPDASSTEELTAR